MIAVIQRVAAASVRVDGNVTGEIARGLVVLAAVHADDTAADVEWTAAKVLGLRIFPSGDKHFDLDVAAAGGAILAVSNFTVAAETGKGRRPSLNPAAGPERGRELFDAFLARLRISGVAVAAGVFGADMGVSLENDGPATFIVDSRTSRPT